MTPRAKSSSTISPLSVPFKDGTLTPDLAKLASATVRVAVPDQLLVQGLTQKNADGTTKALGPIGIDKFELNAAVPLAAAMPATAKWMQPLLYPRVARQPGGQAPSSSSTFKATVSSPGAPDVAAGLKVPRSRPRSPTSSTRTSSRSSPCPTSSPALWCRHHARLDHHAPFLLGSQGPLDRAGAMLNSPLLKMAEPLSIAMLPDRIPATAL